MSLKKHRKTLSNVLNNNNPRVSNDLEAKVLGIGTVLAEVIDAMDEITKAYVLKLERARDVAEDHAADLDIENQELKDQIALLVGELVRLQQEHNYPVAIPN